MKDDDRDDQEEGDETKQAHGCHLELVQLVARKDV